MKKNFFFGLLAVILVIFIAWCIGLFFKYPATEKNPFTKKTSVNKIAEEQKNVEAEFINKLTAVEAELVKKIDSINFSLAPGDCWENRGYIQKRKQKDCFVTDKKHRVWYDNIYNEESGELLAKKKYTSHIGKAYMIGVGKREVWGDLMSSDYDVAFRDETMRYGILLAPDTIGTKVYPPGTFVLSSFASMSDYENSFVNYEYISDFDSFIEKTYEVLSIVRFCPEPMGSHAFQEVIVWL